MPRPDRSALGGGFTDEMSRLSGEYTALVNQAELLRHRKGDAPSKEEAELWAKAADTCDQIISHSRGLRDLRVQWESRKQDCLENVKKIADLLAPPPPKEPKAPPAAKPAAASRISTNTDGGAGTASGADPDFSTRNANEDVSAEMIRSWYQDPPEIGLDELVGVRELKERLMDEVASMGWSKTDAALGINPVQSYFLYGPPGTGKTQLIEAFAKTMMAKGFKYLKLVGGEIHNKYVGTSEKIVTAAFDEAIDAATKHPGCILFMDEVDGVCVNRAKGNIQSHESKLTNAFLEARGKLGKCGKRVVFFGATNFPQDVDPAMLDRVQMIRLPLPDEETREEYFRKIAFAKLVPDTDFTYADMAEATDNFSFREMEALANSVLVRLREQLIHDENNWVLNEKGERDQAATDEKVSAMIESKTVALPGELFKNEKVKLNLPKDKSEIRAKLLAFEQGNA